jgi:hypothetical protein
MSEDVHPQQHMGYWTSSTCKRMSIQRSKYKNHYRTVKIFPHGMNRETMHGYATKVARPWTMKPRLHKRIPENDQTSGTLYRVARRGQIVCFI